MTAVHPMPATIRAKRATFGVIPGISLMTMTAGPDPDAVDGAGGALGGEFRALEVVEGVGHGQTLPPGLRSARAGPATWPVAGRSGPGQGHHHRPVVRAGDVGHPGVHHLAPAV